MPKDNQSELFYLVDDSDQVLGSVSRLEAHQSQTLKHRSVFVLVFTDKEEFILQKRSQSKDSFPGFWTVSASGHVSYGQSYLEAAQRELMEELGLDLDLEELYKDYFVEEREFATVFQAHLSTKDLINFDREEIEVLSFVKIKDLEKFVKENKLTPSALKVLSDLSYLTYLRL